VDLEVRGVPALSYFGRMVWAQTLPDMSAGEHLAEMSTCCLLQDLGAALALMPLISCDTPQLSRISTEVVVLNSCENFVHYG